MLSSATLANISSLISSSLARSAFFSLKPSEQIGNADEFGVVGQGRHHGAALNLARVPAVGLSGDVSHQGRVALRGVDGLERLQEIDEVLVSVERRLRPSPCR